MKFKGGYNIRLAGRPSSKVAVLPEPSVLNLPLQSRRLNFSNIQVNDGQDVGPGHVLAKDPDRYSVPLLAPRGGTVRLEALDGHIVLENVRQEADEPFEAQDDDLHVARDMGSAGMRRIRLLGLGAWQFFHDAFTGDVPDPMGTPQAVIVSTVRFEPYLSRGDVQLAKRLAGLTRGLEHLQSLLEYQPIYLAMPDIQSAFAQEVRQVLRGTAFVQLIEVPMRYPIADFAVLARAVGLRPGGGCVWGLHTEGLLALDRALSQARPCSVRLVSLGGPSVSEPMHLKALPGYPIDELLAGRLSDDPARVIAGGMLTGRTVGEGCRGLDVECMGLTVMPEQVEREFAGWMRPGLGRRSFSSCFLSMLRGEFSERLTTGFRGEKRACIACGQCEDVCPVRIMPYLIHKLLYADDLETAERAGIDRCIGCGLCSYVCPSKIELADEFAAGKIRIADELHPPEPEPEEGEAPAEAAATNGEGAS